MHGWACRRSSAGCCPGAGGTQRAPRLIGAPAALALILGGEPVDGARAKAIGLVDSVAAGDVVAEARSISRARWPAKPRRRVSEMSPRPDDGAIAAARERAQPEARGGLAEHRAIDCVADAMVLPFAEGLARERERFVALLGSEQSKARIHLFFAEREAAKLPDGSAPPPFTVRTAADRRRRHDGDRDRDGLRERAACAVTLIDVKPELVERARGDHRGQLRRDARAKGSSRKRSTTRGSGASRTPPRSTPRPASTSSSRRCSRRWA